MIIIRNDDVGLENKTFIKFNNWINELNIPCTYAIIPYYINNELKNNISKNIEIVMHGYKHENYSNNEIKYEFGDSRTYDQQLHDLTKANNIFERHFPNQEKIFIPPWHKINQDTIKVLNKLNYNKISLSYLEKEQKTPFQISWIHIIFHPKLTKKKDLPELIKKIIALCQNQWYVGINMHHHFMTNKEEEETTKLFLELIKQVSIKYKIKLGKVTDSYNNHEQN